MLFNKFSVCISSLEMLQPLEKGTIARFQDNDPKLLERLKGLGLEIGQAIAVKKRSPVFEIAVGTTRLTVPREMARAIYVKLTDN